MNHSDEAINWCVNENTKTHQLAILLYWEHPYHLIIDIEDYLRTNRKLYYVGHIPQTNILKNLKGLENIYCYL